MTTRGESVSIPCNLCRSDDIAVLSERDRNGDYLRNVICRKCGLIWVDPRPADNVLKTFYADDYRKEYKGITRPRKKHVYRDASEAMARHDFFRDILKKHDRLCDIGAGNGVFVYCLRQLGIEASGVEPDRNHAKYARDVLCVPVQTGFSRDIEFPDVGFDMVTLHHVLEHMTDPLRELLHIRRMLKPGGCLVVEVPNAEDIKQDPGHRYHKAHIYTFNPQTLAALGNKAGFSVFRQKVAPLNGNIAIIFRKTDAAGDVTALPGTENYEKISRLLGRHNSLYHFTRITPYKKFMANLLKAIEEQVKIIGRNSDREIIDQVVEKQKKI